MEKAKPTYQKPSSANKAKVRVPLTPPPMPWLPKNQKKEAERQAQLEKKLEEERKIQEVERKKKEEEALARDLSSLAEWKPRLETLKVGEKIKVDQFSYYTKLSEEGSIELYDNIEKKLISFSGGDYNYVHSRLVCPLCSKKQMLETYISWCGCCDAGEEQRKICSDPKCGIYYVFFSDSRD